MIVDVERLFDEWFFVELSLFLLAGYFLLGGYNRLTTVCGTAFVPIAFE